MSDYFSKFPLIQYNGEVVRDITRRVAFSHRKLNDPLLFLPYTIKEGEKPEDIAYYYYGSVEYTWLVLLANETIDPYYDWPKDDMDFNRYIIDQYTEISGRKGYDVIAWAQVDTVDDNIVFYYKENEDGQIIKIGPQSYTLNAATQAGWKVMRIYDYEVLLNEEKRIINLIDVSYKDKISNEFGNLILK